MKDIMIKYFVCFLILISIPNVVWAGEVSFDCSHEFVIGGRLICSVSVDIEYDVKGILGKYRYDRAFSYLKVNALGKWDLLVNNADGVFLIQELLRLVEKSLL